MSALGYQLFIILDVFLFAIYTVMGIYYMSERLYWHMTTWFAGSAVFVTHALVTAQSIALPS